MKFTDKIQFLPYQQRALDFSTHKDVSYLVLGCGGGKTFISLKGIERCDKVLVVAPVYLEADWRRNIARAYPEDQDKFEFLAYSKLKDSYIAEVMAKFDNCKNNGIIFDEAHYLKTHTAMRTQQVYGRKGMLSRSTFKKMFFLSATPFSNGPSDLYPYLKFFSPKFNNMRFTDFVIRYCGGYEKDLYVNGRVIKVVIKKGFSNIEEFKENTKGLLFYVGPEEIEKDLPPISHEIKILSTALIPQRYRDAEAEYFKAFTTQGLTASRCGFLDMSEVRALMAVEKTRILLEDIHTYFSENANTVIFGWHKDALTMLQVKLKTPYFIHGGVDIKKRDSVIQEFNSTPKGAVILANMQAASTGIELTSADTVIFIELSWDPLTHINQAFKRVHRGDQSKPVKVLYFVLDNSVDIQIMETIKKKISFVDTFFKGE